MPRTPTRLAGAAFLLVLLTRPAPAGPPHDDYGDPLPRGAVARLGTVRLRHIMRDGSGNGSLAFSPDGKTLLSVGGVGLLAWDTATGKDRGWFPDRTSAIAVQFSPDGKTVLTTDNAGSTRLWEAGTGKLLRERKPARPKGFSLVIGGLLSADGKVAGMYDIEGTVLLWDAETGKVILTSKRRLKYMLFSAALSPDGKTLVISVDGSRAHLVDVSTGKELRRIEGPNPADHLPRSYHQLESEAFNGFAFSPDGKAVAASSGKESFSVWTVGDGRLRFTVKDRRGMLAFSADGKHILCGNEGVSLYEAKTGKSVHRFDDPPARMLALCFSPDGRLAAAGGEYDIRVWEVATGKRLLPAAGHSYPVVSLAFSPDGGSLASGDGEGMLIVWGLKDRKPRHALAGHYPMVASVVYSPDGKTIATGDGTPTNKGGFDAQIRLWDSRTGRLVRRFPGHINSVESLSFSPDGRRLASGGHDARTKVWDVATGKRLLQIRGEDTWLRSVAFSPDGKALLVAESPGGLALRRSDSGRKVLVFDTSDILYWRFRLATFLPDGRILTVESSDRDGGGVIHVWDAGSGKLVRSASCEGVSRTGFALSPEGKTLATGSARSASDVLLWDTATGRRVGRARGHTGGGIGALAFSPDGKTLASGGRDTTVLLWDVARVRLDRLWDELESGGADGDRAAKTLADTPESSVPFLRDFLRGVAAEEGRASRAIAALDDDRFATREKASCELEALGQAAELPLRLALRGSPSIEARSRMRKVLRGLKQRSDEDLRLRSILLAPVILKQAGTPAALAVLEELAKGPDGSTVSRAARAALGREPKRR